MGVPDPAPRSSWLHWRDDITLAADGNGSGDILLPAGYSVGIDSVALAGTVDHRYAPLLAR